MNHGLGDNELTHSALREDFELVTRYGAGHPDSWAGAWFDNEPTVRIVAAFTGDLPQHDATLRAQLRHPGRLVVDRRAHSISELRRVRAEIEATLEQRASGTSRRVFSSIGEGKGVVHVALRADQETLARELAARYGSAVELEVGAFSFPDRQPSHEPPPFRAPLQDWEFEGLEVSVELDESDLRVGDDGHARLVLHNSGSERIGPLVSQPITGRLLNASRQAVGGYCGWVTPVGLIVDLEPGQSASIPVLYGTASSRADLGYALPPGSYWLKVEMRFSHGRRGRPPTHVLTAPLSPITIVP